MLKTYERRIFRQFIPELPYVISIHYDVSLNAVGPIFTFTFSIRCVSSVSTYMYERCASSPHKPDDSPNGILVGSYSILGVIQPSFAAV